jgi:hypothetical protein
MVKLFYLINEPFNGYQTGYRKAINELKNQGILSEVYYYSYHSKEKEFGSWARTLEDIKKQIFEFNPIIILIAHLSKNQIIPKIFIDEINVNFKILIIVY